MKKIFRIIIFSLTAIYLTSLWNKGFIISYNIEIMLKASLVVALAYYIIYPISKVILFPINLITMGIASFFIYIFIFYVLTSSFDLIQIKDWVMPKTNLIFFTVPKTQLGFLTNLVLSSFSISFIINLLEKVL